MKLNIGMLGAFVALTLVSTGSGAKVKGLDERRQKLLERHCNPSDRRQLELMSESEIRGMVARAECSERREIEERFGTVEENRQLMGATVIFCGCLGIVAIILEALL